MDKKEERENYIESLELTLLCVYTEFSDNMNRYKCTLENTLFAYTFPFMMGSALEGEPDIEDILYALLMDASAAESGDFDEFVDAYGYDEPKAAYKAFQACVKTSSAMRKMFSIQELIKLHELFEDY